MVRVDTTSEPARPESLRFYHEQLFFYENSFLLRQVLLQQASAKCRTHILFNKST